MMSPRIGEVVCNRYPDQDINDSGYTCIYSLKTAHGKYLYVGQTKNLRKRLATHRRGDRYFKNFDYFFCRDEDANNAEAKAIVAAAPTKNSALPSNDIYISKTEARKLLLNNISGRLFDACKVYQGRGENKLQYIRRDDAERVAEELWELIQEKVEAS